MNTINKKIKAKILLVAALLMGFISIFTSPSHAESTSTVNYQLISLEASQDIKFQNLIKSFMMRGGVAPSNFYYTNIKVFQSRLNNTLALIYIYSEMKSGKYFPRTEEHLNLNSDRRAEEILKILKLEFELLEKASRSSEMEYFLEVNATAFKMLFEYTKTLSEFAPYLNLQSKEVRDIIVLGLKGSVDSLLYHQRDKEHARHSRPYLPAVETGITSLYKILSPPSLFQRFISKIKPAQSPEVSQDEIVKSCSKFFH